MHDRMVMLNPISYLHANGSRNSGLKAMAEIQLLMAIGDRSDLLLFRRDTQDAFLCNTFIRTGNQWVEGVPFPLYFAGIIINHYRSLFRIEYPKQSIASRVTLDGKHGCHITCSVLGASQEGLARLEIRECEIPTNDCSDVVNEYFRLKRKQKPVVRRFYDDLSNWVAGDRLQSYER